MDNLKLPFMESIQLELDGNTTTTGPQQQLTSPKNLKDQAWTLLQELGNLHMKRVYQKTPRLTPQDRREILEIIRDIWEEVKKIMWKVGGYRVIQPAELHLWELQEFPTPLFKKL